MYIYYSVLLYLLLTDVQASSPACTELEVVMMDWLGKMLQLPKDFMSGGNGGGVIQVGLPQESPCLLLPSAMRNHHL